MGNVVGNRHRGALTAVAIAGVLVTGAAVIFWPDFKLQREAKQLMGVSEAEVVARLGAPYSVVTAQSAAGHPSAGWLAEGWHPPPPRPISNKVLLYYSTSVGAVIYVDQTGRVNYVHIVGT
jgi:hypothetical protein